MTDVEQLCWTLAEQYANELTLNDRGLTPEDVAQELFVRLLRKAQRKGITAIDDQWTKYLSFCAKRAAIQLARDHPIYHSLDHEDLATIPAPQCDLDLQLDLAELPAEAQRLCELLMAGASWRDACQQLSLSRYKRNKYRAILTRLLSPDK